MYGVLLPQFHWINFVGYATKLWHGTFCPPTLHHCYSMYTYTRDCMYKVKKESIPLVFGITLITDGQWSLETKRQVFRVKNSVGCCPNSNYVLSSFISEDTTTCQNNATTYRKEHTVSLRHGHTQTDFKRFPYLNPSSFGVVQNNLACTLYWLTTLFFKTKTECCNTYTDRSQG